MLPLVHLKQFVEVTICEVGNNNVNVKESEIVVPSMIKSKSNFSFVIYVTFGSPETCNDFRELEQQQSEIIVPSITSLIHML